MRSVMCKTSVTETTSIKSQYHFFCNCDKPSKLSESVIRHSDNNRHVGYRSSSCKFYLRRITIYINADRDIKVDYKFISFE